MKTKLASIALAAVVVLASGCAAQPFSYIDGRRWFQADMNSTSVIVLSVDGHSDTRNPVMVDPGQRLVRVQGPAAPGFQYGEVRELKLDVKPCMWYYLKGVRENTLTQHFEPQVDYVQPITGCKA
jgi:hypothetical protein